MDIVKDIGYLHKPVTYVLQPKDNWANINRANITTVHHTLSLELEARRTTAYAIAANQLGIDFRAFIFRLDTLTDVFIVNPNITKATGEATRTENCLSLPGIARLVTRPKKIVVHGYNEKWEPVKYTLHGLSARIVCHEIDHLDGKLITDIGREV